jgi:hypothetical protein
VFGLKVVPPGLFAASTLETVTFDTGVRGVAARAFEGCTALLTVRFAVGTRMNEENRRLGVRGMWWICEAARGRAVGVDSHDR